jgi:hypothetical protein
VSAGGDWSLRTKSSSELDGKHAEKKLGSVGQLVRPENCKEHFIMRERIASRCVCCNKGDLVRTPAILMPFVADRVFGWKPVRIDESWGLRTIRTGNAYTSCNSLYCCGCGFLFLDMRFSEVELNNLYRDYRGESYVALRDHYEPGYALRNAELKEGIKYSNCIEEFLEPYFTFPISVLDWGGDTGKNTPFKNRSTRIDVYDVSGVTPIEGVRLVRRAQLDNASYDLIVCSNVLEHISYPLDLLEDIGRVMTRNTRLYLEVPFEAVMVNHPEDPYVYKHHWHEHINFFSETSLRYLVAAAGMKIIELKRLQLESFESPVYLFQLLCAKSQDSR